MRDFFPSNEVRITDCTAQFYQINYLHKLVDGISDVITSPYHFKVS
jgi:hypothetical protein